MTVRTPIATLLFFVAGCACASPPQASHCTTTRDCPTGSLCVDGTCTNGARDASLDGAFDGGPRNDANADAPTIVTCLADGGGCPAGTFCDPSSFVCITPTMHCAMDADCHGDTHCVTGLCVPYLPGEYNHACTRPPVPGFLAPARLCAFTAAPPGDAHPTWLSVSPGLVAADLRITPPSMDGTPHPSIVAVMHANATYASTLQGIIRVIDGATCTQQTVIEAHLVHLESGPAIGDLDGDGVPEIVATSIADPSDPTPGGLVAFRYDSTAHRYGLYWRSHVAGGAPDSTYGSRNMWAGPTLADLDDDGVPEVLMGGAVYDAHGLLIDAHLAAAVDYLYQGSLRLGQFGVTADVDGDPRHIPPSSSPAAPSTRGTRRRANGRRGPASRPRRR